MIDTKKYTRISFFVNAVQVTADNIHGVAKWCDGDVKGQETPANMHIKVKVKRPLTVRQTKAFVGDWVLYAGSGFKVYSNNAFQKCFVPVEEADESGVVDTSTELDDVVEEA